MTTNRDAVRPDAAATTTSTSGEASVVVVETYVTAKRSAFAWVLPGVAGEFLGTFVLVFFGVGVVNAAVVTGAQIGLWQVAVVWAIGVSLAIYASASLSGAHLNPAITAAAVVYDRFPIARGAVYVAAQLGGAMAASILLYAMFGEAILEFERRHGLLRGGPGSELSAMVFGEYFPNPAVFGTAEEAWRIIGGQGAFAAEMMASCYGGAE
jgi:glycerol uptake facilitator protein